MISLARYAASVIALCAMFSGHVFASSQDSNLRVLSLVPPKCHGSASAERKPATTAQKSPAQRYVLQISLLCASASQAAKETPHPDPTNFHKSEKKPKPASGSSSVSATVPGTPKNAVQQTKSNSTDGPQHTPVVAKTPPDTPTPPPDVWIRRLHAAVATLIVVTGLAMLTMCLFNPENRTLTVRRHWGGFGGGVTGWMVSRSVAQLALGLLLVGTGGGLLLFGFAK